MSVLYDLGAPAPRVRVRVRRGTIQSTTQTFVQGDDCEIEEELAHQLRDRLLVQIHGLDEIGLPGTDHEASSE